MLVIFRITAYPFDAASIHFFKKNRHFMDKGIRTGMDTTLRRILDGIVSLLADGHLNSFNDFLPADV
ncbi:hypothetical protein SDC9_150300 [bioreactor metagenome]|uniref:Uncharacterized protein n=1 Tax=bioreactor metagenome TaxID=1076179 RepID=A0A645EMP4_9ZZZZ